MSKQTPVFVTAALAGLLSIPATYAVLRAYDVVFRSEPNPATIVWSAHIAMFWRLAVGAYVAGMVLPLVYWAARHDLAKTMSALESAVVIVAVVIGLQGLFLP
jgi:hypothetical protein